MHHDGSTRGQSATCRSCGGHHTRSRTPSSQVYASYHYRRDLVHAAQVDGALTAARPLPDDALAAGLPTGTVVQAADVRQAIAWEFALRAMREREVMQESL